MSTTQAAIYARVSSERQATAQTIASQLAAPRVGWQWSGPWLGVQTRRGRRSPPGSYSCRIPPPNRLLRRGLLCLCRREGLGERRTASDRHDPFIRLRYTGRTDMARFKYERNLQSLARCVGSTCHDGLLVPGVWELPWRAPRGVGHPETHPRTRGAVGYAEYSSRTLAPGLQLCKECNNSALWRATIRVVVLPIFHVSGFGHLSDDVEKLFVINLLL